MPAPNGGAIRFRTIRLPTSPKDRQQKFSPGAYGVPLREPPSM